MGLPGCFCRSNSVTVAYARGSCQLQAVFLIQYHSQFSGSSRLKWPTNCAATVGLHCGRVSAKQPYLSRIQPGCCWLYPQLHQKGAGCLRDWRGTGRHNCGLKIVAPPNRICHFLKYITHESYDQLQSLFEYCYFRAIGPYGCMIISACFFRVPSTSIPQVIPARLTAPLGGARPSGVLEGSWLSMPLAWVIVWKVQFVWKRLVACLWLKIFMLPSTTAMGHMSMLTWIMYFACSCNHVNLWVFAIIHNSDTDA